MNKKEFAKSILTTGAIIYTAISAAVLIISALLMGDSNSVTESGGQFLNISTHLFILVFSDIIVLFKTVLSDIKLFAIITESSV